MEMADLFSKVINDAEYAGEISQEKLSGFMKSGNKSALAIAEEGTKNFILVFVSGDPEGATLIDKAGLLYGDKVIYLMKKEYSYRVFLIEKDLAESIAARCRIYDKSHLTNRQLSDLPTVGPSAVAIGKLKITVMSGDSPVQGMRVSLRKGRQVLLNDITSTEGSVTFRLKNGEYDCVMTDRDQHTYKFRIDFFEDESETIINIAGEEEI